MKTGDLVRYKSSPPFIGIHKGIGIILKIEMSEDRLRKTVLVHWPSEHPAHQRRWESILDLEKMEWK